MASELSSSAPRDEEDAVAFVVGDAARTLYFSRRALVQHTPFFRRYFIEHAAEAAELVKQAGGTTVVLKHVQPRSAEAALRLCQSAAHADDHLFWQLQRECTEALETQQRAGALQTVLSLYATCVKFELYGHARAASATVVEAVAEETVYDAVKTCARYVTSLPPETRRGIGLDALLRACAGLAPPPATWRSASRRWRRLAEQYPELPEALAAAAAATASSRVAPRSTAARLQLLEQRRALLSPQEEAAAAEGASAATSASALPASASQLVPGEGPAAPLPGVFAGHLVQTEQLALAARRRWRVMTEEVAALRAECARLSADAALDEAASAETAAYLGDLRVYVQALRAAEADMRSVCAAVAALPSMSADASLTTAATLHELRHTLQCTAAEASAQRTTVEEELRQEQDAVDELTAEVARLCKEFDESADCEA